MRRIYVRILVVLLATAVVSLIAFVVVFFRLTEPTIARLVESVQELALTEAVAALNEQGSARAGEVLAARGIKTNAVHHLTDADGRDLVTGDNRSAMLAAASRTPRPTNFEGQPILVRTSEDGTHRLITIPTRPFGLFDILPYYALLLTTIALLTWLLVINLVSPLRKIARAVDDFGRGQFDTRTGVVRSDEIGALAQTFDAMAERIELLVSAERRLLRDVSHELRSPLTRLNLAVELSRNTVDRDAAAARLQRDVDRLSRLVGALLEVTRLEGEGLHVLNSPVDVADLLAEVIADVEIEAEARKVRIAASLEPLAVIGDWELLRRAFENVIRNAIRYAPAESSVDITVNVAEDGAVEVGVRDYGPGVPEEMLDRLGTPFFRVDSARDAASGGVGLGLSIARRAIARHKGVWQLQNASPGLLVSMTLQSWSTRELKMAPLD